ncbi:MAG: response regulator [Bacteroidetes bacterium]|nr:response regulator [Bacteroidota bacterium]
MSKRVLIVDDGPDVLASLRFQLGRKYEVETAQGVEQGLSAIVNNGPYAVVISDMRMPRLDGIQFLAWVKTKAPDTVRILLTAYADLRSAMDAVNNGNVFRFLTKPCPPPVLLTALEEALKQYRLVTTERELLEKTLGGTVAVMADILEMVDEDAFGRAQKVRDHAKLLAKALAISNPWEVEMAALLCQMGYVTVPEEVTKKQKRGLTLSNIESAIIARVPEIGRNLLIKIPRLETVAEIVQYQNKNFDGTGFPTDNISGEKIPLGARILKVLLDFVHLTEDGLSGQSALEEMKGRTGYYDPKIFDAAAVSILGSEGVDMKTAEPKMVFVSVGHLYPGLVLCEQIETVTGLKLVSAGTKITEAMLEKVRNFAELTGVKEPLVVEKHGL